MQRWFLSYNSQDVGLVQGLEAALRRKMPEAQIFFAPKSLRAGGYWLPTLADEIAKASAFVLTVGGKGLGPWQVVEYYEALDRRVKEPEFPVLVVLLEGETAPGLPFLRQLHWVVTPDMAAEQTAGRLIEAASGRSQEPLEPWRYASPYRGLAAMTEADSDFFFGRGREIARVLDALGAKTGTLPILLGNSGVGKSSLAQAGVLAALKRQAWPSAAGQSAAWPQAFRESRHWCFLTLKPGVEPIRALVAPFLDVWQFGATDPERAKQQNGWIELLAQGKAGLGDLIDATERRRQEIGQGQPPKYFLYVDQGEELYARASENQRLRFSQALAAGLGDPRFHALMSLRADFLGALQSDEALFAVHEKVDVPPLRDAELREVVARPAALLGARFESENLMLDIVRRAAEESTRDAGALPLLSYLLDDMWTQMAARGDGILRLPAHALELGGVLAERANAFLSRHPAAEETLRRVLTLKLASVREDGEPTRRVASRSQFSDEEWRLVSELADYPHRLLITATPDGGETYAEVAHEAIFRRWDKLREWLSAEREFLIWRGGLEADRRNWEQTPDAQRNDALLMGLALAQAQSWLAKRAEDVASADREFIELSLQREALERRQRESLRRRLFATMIGALVVVSGLAGFALLQWRDAAKQRQAALDERDRAQQAITQFFVQFALTSTGAGGDAADLELAVGQNPTDEFDTFLRAIIDMQKERIDAEIADLDRAVVAAPGFEAPYLLRGLAYSSKADYLRAIADYNSALALNPRDAVTYNIRGFAYRKLKKFDLALKDYDAAIALDPKFAVALDNRGDVYLDKGDPDLALPEFEAAIKLAPQFAAAYNDRGLAYYGKKDFSRAIADYSAAIDLAPKYVVALTDRGEALIETKDYDGAIADLDRAIAIDPKSVNALGSRGQAYAAKKDFARAIADYDAAAALDPKDAEVFDSRGLAYADQGDYARAFADFGAALKLEPEKVNALINRGRTYEHTKDYVRAIADFDAAIKLEPNSADALASRGLAYAEMKDFARALADYDASLKLDPDNAFTLGNRGVSYADTGDFARALADYDASIKHNPNNAMVFGNRGFAHAKMKDYSQAIADYDVAITLDPSNAITIANRGFAHASTADFARAIVDYDAALKLDPNNAVTLGNRGFAYAGAGDFARALVDYDASLALNPNAAAILFDRGLAHARLKDVAAAVADYSAAVKLSPTYAAALFNRGYLYLGERDVDHALADIDEGLRIEPRNPLAYISRGRAHMLEGDYDKAIADFTQALDIQPNAPLAYVGRGVVYRIKRDFDRALADMDEALRRNPKLAIGYYARGNVRRAAGEIDKIDADYAEAIGLDPKGVGASATCWSELTKRDFASALEACDQSPLIDALDAYSRDSRGFAYLGLGRFADAKADFDAALSLDPSASSSLYGRALMKAKMGDQAGAEADLAAAKAIRPNIERELQKIANP